MARFLVALLLATQASAGTPLAKVVEDYCANCHDSHVESSGTSIEPLDPYNIAGNPHVWSRAERHLRAGTMPPAGSPRPDRQTINEAIATIERALDVSLPADSSTAIATRLASLLWNAEPDKRLAQAARRDQLRDTATLEREVRRMLADPQAESFVARFLVPWLQLDRLKDASNGKRNFPEYDPQLRDALRRETELFLLSQLQDDRDPIELWTANYTFLNEQLAKHYGINGVTGTGFHRVTLRAPERVGLLGQGGVLMATSRFRPETEIPYTSPAARASWLLTRFLGVFPPGGLPGAPPIRADLPIAGQLLALADNPCKNCHRGFFPMGHALENFDPVGRWRTADQVGPVNAAGVWVDGTPFNGPVELRKGLLQRPDAFRTTVTERLLVFAAGGPFVTHRGSPQTLASARHILRDGKQVRWSSLIAGVVRAKPVALD